MASRVKRDHHTWTRDTVKNVSGDVTLDLAGDLTIDVAGGQCTIADDGLGEPDLILQGTTGLTIGPQFYIKHDSGSPAINDYPGAIYIQGKDDAGNTQTYAQMVCQIEGIVDGSEKSKLTIGAASPTVGGLILEGISDGRVDADIGLGTASLTTIAGDLDIDGDTITSAGALEIDPGGALSITGQDVKIDATKKLYLDGGTDTYIIESSDDLLDFFVGGERIFRLIEGGGGASDGVHIPATTPLYLGGDTYIHEASADKLEIVVGDDEMLTLDEANQRVTIEADKLSYKTVGGTVKEFSVADSAYAGTILGYTTVGIDAADDSYTLTTTMTCLDDALKVKFVAPPSGVVEIMAQIYFDTARRAPVLGLSDQNATTGYQAISFPNATDVTNEHLQVVPATLLGDSMLRPHWVVTGLTAGTAYEWWIAAKTSLGTGGVLKWGGDATNEYPPFIMKATALPTAVTDYAVYG